MSKNYFGNYIYEYDLNRDKDFFKNISYSTDLNTSLENTKYGPRFGNNCIQFDDKLFTFGGTSIETKDNGQILYKVNNDIYYYDGYWNDFNINYIIDFNQFMQPTNIISNIDFYKENNNIILFNIKDGSDAKGKYKLFIKDPNGTEVMPVIENTINISNNTFKIYNSELNELNIKSSNFVPLTNYQLIKFNSYYYIIGGMVKTLDDNYNNLINRAILRTQDFKNWQRIQTNLVGIGTLFNHKCFIFNSKLWLINNGVIYNSINGITWNEINNLDILKSDNFGIATDKNNIYLFMGIKDCEEKSLCYKSSDGYIWEFLSDLPFDARYYFSNLYSSIYGNLIICGRDNSNVFSDIWKTDDFVSFEKLDIEIPSRYLSTCGIYNESIYIFNGIYESNLEISSNTFAIDLYDDLYRIGQSNKLLITPKCGTIKCGKIKCGKSLVTYNQYDEIDKLIKSGYKLDSLNPIVKRV